MPNHITNIITASPKVIEAITRFHTEQEKADYIKRETETAARYKESTGKDYPIDTSELEDRFVDFNLLVPMPEEVAGTTVGTGGEHMMSQSGWYGWSLAHWGTKWNGYSTQIEPLEDDRIRLSFQTAWSHPEPIITTLSEKFPDEKIEVEWADEDFGSNLGTYTIQGGQESDLYMPDWRTDEKGAKTLAARILCGETLEEYEAREEAEERAYEERQARFEELQAAHPDKDRPAIWAMIAKESESS